MSEAKNVTWTIGKASGSMSLNKTSLSLGTSTPTGTITVTRAGNGTITASSNNTNVATVSVSGTTVTVTAKNNGSCTITVKCAEGTNHLAPTDKTVSVSVVLEYPLNLNSMSWAEISNAVKAGNQNAFKVGAYKDITFPSAIMLDSSNTVFNIDANSTWRAYIIGVDHNSSLEGTKRLHWCIGKTTDNIEICFNHYKMNSSNTNSGGWNGSAMKTWLNGTFYNALPSDLRAVITGCTKYTDNTGNKSESEGNVTSTSQKIWLMAPVEVSEANFKTSGTVNPYEPDKQATYDYYKNGNSRVRYEHYPSRQNITSNWWLRSPYRPYATEFTAVSSLGNVSDSLSGSWLGFVPCFTIS